MRDHAVAARIAAEAADPALMGVIGDIVEHGIENGEGDHLVGGADPGGILIGEVGKLRRLRGVSLPDDRMTAPPYLVVGNVGLIDAERERLGRRDHGRHTDRFGAAGDS